MLQHDYYTYTHVTNVCTYALILAKGLGMSSFQELRAIAVGALLHDLGKRLIPTAILNKPARLTENEMRVVQQHPTTGFRDLSARTDLTLAQLMMVYQHHERLDGSGYPVRIVGDEIHPWARLCAVVDVFDAFTCCRPYRHATPAQEVIKFLVEHAGKAFDEEMVRCWISLL